MPKDRKPIKKLYKWIAGGGGAALVVLSIILFNTTGACSNVSSIINSLLGSKASNDTRVNTHSEQYVVNKGSNNISNLIQGNNNTVNVLHPVKSDSNISTAYIPSGDMPNRAFILHWLSAFNSIEIEKYNSLLDNNVKVSVHKLFRNPTETGKNSTYNKDQWANRLALERIGGKVDILDLDKLSTTDYPCNNNECILVGNLYSCYYCARVEVHIGYIKDSLTGEWRIIKEEYIAKESQESCISNTEGTFYSTLDSITAMYNTGWNAEWFQNHRADKVKIYGDNKVPMFLDAINQKDYLKSFGYYHLTNQNLDSDDPACLDYNVINAFPKYQDYQYCYSHSYKNLKLSARLLNTEVKYEYNFNYDGNTFRLQSIQVIK